MKISFWKRLAQLPAGFGLGSLVLVGFLAAGCQTSREDIRFSAPPPDLFMAVDGASGSGGTISLADNADRLREGDFVTVRFSGTVDVIPQHEERIKEDGTITLPHIGAVKAIGKTTGELQKEIHDLYVTDYYKRLTVTVTADQRVYYVGGYVRNPGRQHYLGPTTVTKAIQSAGDVTDFADRARVELTRADGTKHTVDCNKAAKDPSLDLPVFPGDKIHVPMRGWRSIFSR